MRRKQVRKLASQIKSDLARNTGGEEGHMEADDSLCELLTALGYSDVVDQFHKVHKWYA